MEFYNAIRLPDNNIIKKKKKKKNSTRIQLRKKAVLRK